MITKQDSAGYQKKIKTNLNIILLQVVVEVDKNSYDFK
tara:strand:- start:724 stop:837 length:114 start_codon:yes stop_codon:yes gene_type:complete